MFGQWLTFGKFLKRNYRSYGGFRGVLASPFLGLAVLVSALTYSEWMKPGWIEKAESLIPNLLGFSLGTYAILFSIMSGRIKGALRSVKSPHGVSYLESINSTFFHFIFVQVLCLLWAFLFQGTWLFDIKQMLKSSYPWAEIAFYWMSLAGSFVGCTLLVYSILLMIAAALAVYRLALLKDPSEDARE